MVDDKKHERFLLPLFDGTNFTTWKFRMRVLLEEKELLECVETKVEDVAELTIRNWSIYRRKVRPRRFGML